MQLDGQMHRFFFCRFETYPPSGLRFEPTRTTFRGRSYRHLNRLNRRSAPPSTPDLTVLTDYSYPRRTVWRRRTRYKILYILIYYIIYINIDYTSMSTGCMGSGSRGTVICKNCKIFSRSRPVSDILCIFAAKKQNDRFCHLL